MRHLMKCIFILTLVFSINLLTAQKNPFTIDDLYRLKSISTPEISPDGKKLLFSVTEYDLKKGKSNSDIFLLDLANGEQLQLTYDEGADFNPFWSSDGQKIYFISC